MNCSTFFAVDVEVACNEIASICQLGLAKFADGMLVSLDTFRVRPRSPFAKSNIALHGLDKQAVQDAPDWAELYSGIRAQLTGQTIVSHTFFDRRAIFKACCRERVAMFSYVRWLDTCEIARRAWPGLRSHRLGMLAQHFGLRHRAHDAGEDARVAGEIYLLAQQAIAAARLRQA